MVANFQTKLFRVPGTAAHAEPLKCRGYKFSVQASDYHYSEPRDWCAYTDYTEMEVAIFDSDGDWCVLADAEEHEFGTRFEKWDGATTSVTPYMEVENIQALLNAVALGEIRPIKLSDYLHMVKADREIEACINGMDVV